MRGQRLHAGAPAPACHEAPTRHTNMDVQALSPEVIQDTQLPPTQVDYIPADSIDNLISSSLDSSILSFSDEWFAPASNLTNPKPPIRRPGVFVPTGAWYDGWETRRHNPAPYDWVIIKLGVASGRVKGAEVDTAFFDGNHAEGVEVHGCYEVSDDADEKVVKEEYGGWTEVLGYKACGPSQRRGWMVEDGREVTHVRLCMFPDGGIARFRLYGRVVPVFPMSMDQEVELSAAVMGGMVVSASEEHFGSSKSNLILPGRGVDMGDGWETRRSREKGHVDWAIVRLGARGLISRVVVDTAFYRGNFPKEMKVDAIDCEIETPSAGDSGWKEVVALHGLNPDKEHHFPTSRRTAVHKAAIQVADVPTARHYHKMTTESMKPETDLPCLLCLHGGGTSAYIFSIQTRRLQNALAKHFRFVFLDAPFECPAGPGVLPFFDGFGPYRRWVDADGNDRGQVRPLLRKAMAEDGGNFVGVLGFSQGARLALGLLHEKQEKHPEAFEQFGFGVFICGTYPPLSLSSALFPATPTAMFESQYWEERHKDILSLPSIHVVGSKDPFAYRSRLLVRCSQTSSLTVMEFNMGHHLPVMPADTRRLADGIIRLHHNHQLELNAAKDKASKKTSKQKPLSLILTDFVMAQYDVVIVGAGPQGLVMAKTVLQLSPNISILILDSNRSIGGVWAKENLYPGLRTNNQAGTFEFTDLDILDVCAGQARKGEHIPGEVAHDYLLKYAEHFDILRRVRLEQKVIAAEHLHREDGGWELTVISTAGGTQIPKVNEIDTGLQQATEVITARKLVVATGLTSMPLPISLPGASSFSVPLMTFGDFRGDAARLLEDPEIEHVAVYGGSKAAYDAVYAFASRSKKVTWIIRESGYGPVYMAPSHIYLGPFKAWIESLVTTRLLTWLSPCIWGESDGFGSIRRILHQTRIGRWIVKAFWKKLGGDTITQSGLLQKGAEVKKLVPTEEAVWYGAGLSILNYNSDIHQFVQDGRVRVVRRDIDFLQGRKVGFKGTAPGEISEVEVDAMICSTGWRWDSGIDFLPKAEHADLGIPSEEYTPTQTELWSDLDAQADAEILGRFPMLAHGPKIEDAGLEIPKPVDSSCSTIPREKGVLDLDDQERKRLTPWRLVRGIAPPANPKRDLVFLGMMTSLQTFLRSELSALWAYAYLMDSLDPLVRLSTRATLPPHHSSPICEKKVSESTSASPSWLYETALFSRFGRWRSPMGYGARYPDYVFDGLPFFDLLLGDLGLRRWRKGYG
ncbi:MAG: hypothetical protein Q9170_007203, partial [Blastenia crenularia]